MNLIVDASAVVDLLLTNDLGLQVADRLEANGAVWSVAHLDAEVLSALARLNRSGALSADDVSRRLDLLDSMDIDRLPIAGVLLHDAWALRERVAMRDALYIAAAAALDGLVLTTDDRLRRAAPKRTTGPA